MAARSIGALQKAKQLLDYEYDELLEALEQSSLPILVQAHDWARLPESFHREIESDYVVVQAGLVPKTEKNMRE